MFLFIVILIALFWVAFSYIPGLIACSIVGDKQGGALKYIGVGIAGGIVSGAIGAGVDVDHVGLGIALYCASILGIAYLLKNKDESVKDETMDKKVAVEKQDNTTQESEITMSNLDYKNLIRIPVWALYSLIMATVIISLVIVVNIWVPEAIDEEIIWKIVITYGVFLVGALVIFNITDKIKEMNKYEEKK
jgi:hypothetical protein